MNNEIEFELTEEEAMYLADIEFNMESSEIESNDDVLEYQSDYDYDEWN